MSLLRVCEVVVVEPPPGIRANLLRTFSAVPAARMMKAPNERTRLYFLLAWFHAVVQERLRYCPLGKFFLIFVLIFIIIFTIICCLCIGWTKNYEFNESDLNVACDTLDTWIDATAQGRTNLPPEKVPWDALVNLLSQCIYGGKIDNEFDQRLLASFLSKLFTPRSFEPDFALVASIKEESDAAPCRIVMPEGIRRDQFLQWIGALSDNQSPAWLGLPNNAERVLLTTRGSDMVAKLLMMRLFEDDDDDEADEADRAAAAAATAAALQGRPAWMRSLLDSAGTWLGLLPDSLVTLRRTVENIKSYSGSLYRFFEREVNSGTKLLQDVRTDLADVLLICQVIFLLSL